MSKVYVVTGMTESGDDIEPLVFFDLPNDVLIQNALKERMGSEYEYVSWIHIHDVIPS